jgi:hypothetical protein
MIGPGRRVANVMRCAPILLALPLASGCLGFGLPSVERTPAVAVPEPDVHVFRITSDSTFRTSSYSALPPQCGPGCSVWEVSVRDGMVPAGPFASYFPYFYLTILGDGEQRFQSTRLCLYRRGYETVTVEACSWLASLGGNKPETVAWKTADTLEARVRAIDALGLGHNNSWHWLTSDDVRSFVRQEYLALADSPLAAGSENEEARERLRRKAKLAGKDPFASLAAPVEAEEGPPTAPDAGPR